MARVRAVAAMLQEHHLSDEHVVPRYPPGADCLGALFARSVVAPSWTDPGSYQRNGSCFHEQIAVKERRRR